MLIARYKYSGGRYQGIGEIFGCDTYNEYPSTYPPTLQYEPLIYNNDPNVYVTHETTGVRFYNSAVFKDVTNNRAYVILISNPTMYYYSHSYAEGRTDSYNGRGPTNRVYNDYSTGYAKSMDLSSSDNLATFESDLPIFTNYQDYYDYATSLHEPPDQNRSGGAGSGYIGNLLLSNKKMVGYNVPTSSAESTKTESVDEASENPVSGKPKIGNGFARIKFLRDVQPQPEPGYEDILNKLQNYIIWGSWNFKTQDMKEYYSGNRNITCDFPCAIINQGRTLQSNSWTSGTSYFCGGCRVDVNGEDDVGYDIVISNMVNTKPIHRDGIADDACNKATQIIYLNSGSGATGIGRPSEDTLPSTVTYRYEYSTIKLRNALEMMINMIVGSCDLFVNGSPWILR